MNSWSAILIILAFRLLRFVFIFCIVLFLATSIQQRLGKKSLLGITIGAALIIAGAVYDLFKFTDWPYYQFTFQDWPERVILARYVFSLLWRVILLATGIGLVYLKDWARKVIILLAGLQIVGIFLKHPLGVFKHLALFNQQEVLPQSLDLIYPLQPLLMMVFFSVFDITISVLIIYYFSRPNVKENFS
jgi:hypothetical protein